MKEETLGAFAAGVIATFALIVIIAIAYAKGYDTGKRLVLPPTLPPPAHSPQK